MKSITFRNQISNHFFKFNTEIIHFLREHCEIIFISSAKDFVSSVSKLNSISSRQKRQESSSENLTSAFDIKSIHDVWEFFEISFIYLASQRFSSIFAMTSIFKSLEVFNSKYFCSDSEKRIFCEIASFLQHFQQCLHLFCESNLLHRIKAIMYDVVNKWFDNQSKFISLHDFDIVLIKTFSSSEFTTIQLISLTYKQQKLKATISSLSFNFDFYDLLRDIDFFDSSLKHNDSNLKHFNETSNFLRNLQHCQHLYRYRKTHLFLFLFNCLNDSIFKWLQKQSHFDNLHIFSTILTNVFSSQQQKRKARARKRTNRKVAKKIIKDAKSTSKLQNIDIFDSTSCNESEFELYSETTSFLQSFQQCQHQYRKSDLLNLLSKCLCDFASEWFKIQSEFISLKRFNRILAKTFSEASLRRASSKSSNLQLCTFVAISKSIKNASNQQVVQMICKFCKQNFNFTSGKSKVTLQS